MNKVLRQKNPHPRHKWEQVSVNPLAVQQMWM